MICRTCCEHPVLFSHHPLRIAIHADIDKQDGMGKHNVRLLVAIHIVIHGHIGRDFIDIPSQYHFFRRLYYTRIMCPVIAACVYGSWQGQREYQYMCRDVICH